MVSRKTIQSILPIPNGKKTLVKDNHSTADIMYQIVKADSLNRNYGKKIAPYFKGSSVKQTCQNIYNFLRNEIKYKMEDPKEQTTKDLSRFVSDGFGDCKHYAGFFASILEALNIPGSYRFVSFSKGNPTHVYVVAIDEQGRPVYCDACIPFFNTEKKFYSKTDKPFTSMPLFHLSGAEAGLDTYLGDIDDESYFEEDSDSSDDTQEDSMPIFSDDSESSYSNQSNSPAPAPTPVTYAQPAPLPGFKPAVIPTINPFSRARVAPSSLLSKQHATMTRALKQPLRPTPKSTPINKLFRTKKPGFFGDPDSLPIEYLSYVGCVNGVDVYSDAMGNVFTKLGKAIKKSSAGKVITKIAKKGRGLVKKAVKAVKKVGLSVPRQAYLLMVSTNVHSTGTRLQKGINKKPDQVQKLWNSLGGDFAALKRAAKDGSSKKAIFGIGDPEYNEHIGIAPLAAAASAAPIIAAMIPLLNKIIGEPDPEGDKLAQQATSEFEKQTGSKVSETEFAQEPESGVSPITSNQIFDTKTGVQHTQSSFTPSSTGSNLIIPVLIGGGLLFLFTRSK